MLCVEVAAAACFPMASGLGVIALAETAEGETHALQACLCLRHHQHSATCARPVTLLQEPPMLPGLVQQQLQQLAATSRVGAALVILQWLRLVADRIRQASAEASAAAAEAAAAVAASSVALATQLGTCVPEQLPDSCLVYLGAPAPSLPSLPATEPYTELAASYGQMRRELYQLMNVCLEVGAGWVSSNGRAEKGCGIVAAVVPTCGRVSRRAGCFLLVSCCCVGCQCCVVSGLALLTLTHVALVVLLVLLCRWALPCPLLRASLWRLSVLMPAWPWSRQCLQRWTAGTYGWQRLLCSQRQLSSR